MPSLELVTFDLDGTLVDTAAEIVEAAQRTLDHFGLPRQPVHEVIALIGHGTRALMQGVLARVERAAPSPRMSRDDVMSLDAVMPVFDDHYTATTGTTARPYEGCIDMLAALHRAGLRLACVTNKEERHARRVLRATGLEGHFDLLVGGDTLPVKKPHPDVLRTVASRMGVAIERVVHVGDSSVDVESARQAGVPAWVVPWGYNGGKPITDSQPDRVFDSFAQLRSHVTNLMSKA